MGCVLCCLAHRYAHPSDGSRSVTTLPPDNYGDAYQQRHRGVGTRDDSCRRFQVFYTKRAFTVAFTIQLYFTAFTMQLWSYCSYTRYYYGGSDMQTSGQVYAMALTGGILSSIFVALAFVWVNRKLPDDEEQRGDLPPDRMIRAKRHAQRQNRMELRRRAEMTGDMSILDEDAEGPSMADISMDQNGIDESAADAAAAADAKMAGDGVTFQKELISLLRVMHPAYGLDLFEEAPLMEQRRSFRLVERVIFVLWVFEFVLTVMDFSAFVEITDPSSKGYEVTGGVNALFGISILLGTGLSLFPPWYLYQIYAVRWVAKRYA